MFQNSVKAKLGTQEAAIKNILFDLGNVLIDIDLNRTIERFRKLGLSRFDDVFSFDQQTKIFEQFETGDIPVEIFRDHIRSFIPAQVTAESIDDAWSAMLGVFPEERLKLLERLKVRYNLYLLSNTNEIHVRRFVGETDKKFGGGTFNRLFIKTYYSNEIHIRKPNTEVYQYVLKDAEILSSETLFIDDTLVNIEGARKAGLMTHWLEDKNVFGVFEAVTR